MSQQAKWEFSIGVATILLSMLGSLTGSVWYAAKMSHQIEANRQAIESLDNRIVELSKIILKDSK